MEKTTIIGAIIPAAGKGTRLESKTTNKVVLKLGDRPMISYTVELLQKLRVSPIIVVVGFAKESVMQVLENQKVTFAIQEEQLGVAHAVACGIKELPSWVSHVIVMNGDDSAFYGPEVIEKLIQTHLSSESVLTFLTLQSDNPKGLGRVKRSVNNRIEAIIEEKDATEEERGIREVNIGCYLFKVNFLKEYLPLIEKSTVSDEYYITDIVSLAAKNNLKIVAIQSDTMIWRGVNTKEELDEAQQLFLKQK